MIFGLLILGTALMLSSIAAFYSIVGLVAIFSAMPIPIIIMGGSLEIAKIVTTVFLHNNWKRLSILYKMYLVPAVVTLMLLTSLGIFGLLSKAHSDQSLVSGDVLSKVAIYDEKIKTQKDNIDANRKALKQMDEGVDSVLGRSADEKGADKAVALRRAQQKERVRLQTEILQSQKSIAELNDARAPIAAEVRKVEAEVGPIKYIAAFIYGDNPDQNVLEHAVRWVIILIVIVFDPLALTLILAANKQFEWARQGTGGFVHDEPTYEPDDGPLSEEQIEQLREIAEPELPTGKTVTISKLFDDPGEHPADTFDQELPQDPHPPGWMYRDLESNPLTEAEVEQVIAEFDQVRATPVEFNQDYLNAVAQDIDQEAADNPAIKAAIKKWKTENPDGTIKEERAKLAAGRIQYLPWMNLVADYDLGREPTSGFGIAFPAVPIKGDTYMRVDRMPNVLYKFNGIHWIIVDKNLTDNYTYDDAYVEHLIAKLTSGEYDPDLLSDAEADAIARRVKPI